MQNNKKQEELEERRDMTKELGALQKGKSGAPGKWPRALKGAVLGKDAILVVAFMDRGAICGDAILVVAFMDRGATGTIREAIILKEPSDGQGATGRGVGTLGTEDMVVLVESRWIIRVGDTLDRERVREDMETSSGIMDILYRGWKT